MATEVREPAQADADPASTLLDAYSQAVIRVVERVAPSVVNVRRGRSGGSGVIVTPDGYALTNAHVVEGAREVSVTLTNETEPVRAPVVGADPATDLAVVRIPRWGLPAAELRLTAPSGIRVLEVAPGGPAERAGLQRGDLLVGLNDLTLATLSDLQGALVADSIGKAVELRYVRQGELRRAAVTLVEARSS